MCTRSPSPICRKPREKGLLYRAEQYRHRYPVCWRCGTDLVFRLVDEWFIAMDELREPMMHVTRQINWDPSFGLDRELDWLAHMDDWMISKKRYWGLALPIYECAACGNVEVIGSEDGAARPCGRRLGRVRGSHAAPSWIDEVKIACSACGGTVSRIKDVGNPWLDAGIVAILDAQLPARPRSTGKKWYPADMISESFPGQFRNWFYSMIAQSTALVDRPAFRNVFSYALMRDEKGEEMHKSKGNAIWFDEAAEGDRGRRDALALLAVPTRRQPQFRLSQSLDDVRRRFILPLWNSYSLLRHLRSPRSLRSRLLAEKQSRWRSARCWTGGSSLGSTSSSPRSANRC